MSSVCSSYTKCRKLLKNKLRGVARLLGQQGFYVRFDVDGTKAAAVPAHGNTVGAHQELLKVPGNVVAAHRRPNDVLGVGHERSGVVTGCWQGIPQEGKERVSLLTIHFALLKQCKIGLEPATRSDVLEGIQNLFILAILLVSELIARETEHHQSTRSQTLLQIVHLGVVPDRGASERRDILNEQHLAPQGAQAHRLPARQRARGEGIHGGLCRRGEPSSTHTGDVGV